MIVVWSEILSKFNNVSRYLQKPDLDLFTTVNVLKGLKTYINTIREKFNYSNKIKQYRIVK